MGSMACYTETCPDCGRVPPSRSKEIKKYRDNLEKVTFDKPSTYCFSLRFYDEKYRKKYILIIIFLSI